MDTSRILAVSYLLFMTVSCILYHISFNTNETTIYRYGVTITETCLEPLKWSAMSLFVDKSCEWDFELNGSDPFEGDL